MSGICRPGLQTTARPVMHELSHQNCRQLGAREHRLGESRFHGNLATIPVVVSLCILLGGALATRMCDSFDASLRVWSGVRTRALFVSAGSILVAMQRESGTGSRGSITPSGCTHHLKVRTSQGRRSAHERSRRHYRSENRGPAFRRAQASSSAVGRRRAAINWEVQQKTFSVSWEI